MDKEIEKICNDIYKKYKGALDLIYEYRPDEIAVISEYIKDFLETNAEKYGLIFDRENSSKSYIRFTTNYMNDLIPRNEDYSYGWKNGYSFMYEIEIINNYKCCCIGSISNTANSKCIELYKLAQANSKRFHITHKNAELPNVWARVFRSNTLLEKEHIQNGLSECKELLNKNLLKLFENEIPAFEKFLKDNNL